MSTTSASHAPPPSLKAHSFSIAVAAAAASVEAALKLRLQGTPELCSAAASAEKPLLASGFHPPPSCISSTPAPSYLPEQVLWALLEDPVTILCSQPPESYTYRQVGLHWNTIGEVPKSSDADHVDIAGGALHEVSQTFVRDLSFGRRLCYRLHRFHMVSAHGLEMSQKLTDLAVEREQTADLDDQLHVSNVGGYHSKQDIFSSGKYAAAAQLQRAIAACVREVAAADAAEMAAVGEDHPPVSAAVDSAEVPDCWVNVSRYGSLNHLHHHAGASLAAVYYAQVPQDSGGALVLRLSRGQGQGMAEPDEERHVPWMWPAPADDLCGENLGARGHGAASGAACPEGTVLYALHQPTPHTLLLFPAWLSHSVAPYLGSEPRVSLASNWDLPVPEERELGEEG